jgi:hypothetical protein
MRVGRKKCRSFEIDFCGTALMRVLKKQHFCPVLMLQEALILAFEHASVLDAGQGAVGEQDAHQGNTASAMSARSNF